LKKILPILIGLAVLTKLIDFLFYGRQLNDLAGVVGFVLLLVGVVLPDDQAIKASGARGTNTGRALIGIVGTIVLAIHFLVKWKILGT
jgi:hypothetical protein